MADDFHDNWGLGPLPSSSDPSSSDADEEKASSEAGSHDGADHQVTGTGADSGESTPTQALPTQESEDSRTTQALPTASAPEYSAGEGRQTAQPRQDAPYYRPAPQYGAYAPSAPAGQTGRIPQQGYPYGAPASSAGAQGGYAGPEQGQQQNPQRNPQGWGGRNPYYPGNPFLNPSGSQTGRRPEGPVPAGDGNGANPQGTGTPQGPQGPMFVPGPQGPGRAATRTRRRTASGIVIAVVAALVSAALCLGVGYAAITRGWVTVPTSGSLASVSSNSSGSGTATAKSGESVDWTAVAKEVSSAVVSIQTTLSDGTAKGSGAIINSKGYIVTNNHVISDATAIQVTLTNGQIYSAKVVGTDSTTDLAVIKLVNPPSDLTTVTFADSDNLAVGEAVMAIGNPLGYDDTATTGIVSALNRPVSVTAEIVTNAVQIDAAINPGNSGGPTFNAAGQVVGINSSIASTASSSSEAGSIGIGFAIPSNLVKKIANEIISDGSATHVALGITITSTTVTADGVTRGGAKITSSSGSAGVVSGSPADKAGLKVGDTIVAFNGNAVSNSYSLLGYVRAASLNDKVTLTVVRDSKTISVSVTLNKKESDVNGSSSSSSGSSGNSENNDNGSGNSDNGDGGLTDPFGLW